MTRMSARLQIWVGGLALVVAVLVTGSAGAHHGWGSYDAERPITVTGRIEKVAYGNPHVQIVVEADGKRWDVVLAPVSRMEARGATADVVSLGRNISVYGYPSREKPNEMRAESITVDDRTYEMR
jgi:Family of unknown function (DUF6152)